MKLKSIVPSKGTEEIRFNEWEEDGAVLVIKNVIAYGHYSDGEVYPMVTDNETGKLVPVHPENVIYFTDDANG
jgi:hypothetical protein